MLYLVNGVYLKMSASQDKNDCINLLLFLFVFLVQCALTKGTVVTTVLLSEGSFSREQNCEIRLVLV